jgi:hypothetical protein
MEAVNVIRVQHANQNKKTTRFPSSKKNCFRYRTNSTSCKVLTDKTSNIWASNWIKYGSISNKNRKNNKVNILLSRKSIQSEQYKVFAICIHALV